MTTRPAFITAKSRDQKKETKKPKKAPPPKPLRLNKVERLLYSQWSFPTFRR